MSLPPLLPQSELFFDGFNVSGYGRVLAQFQSLFFSLSWQFDDLHNGFSDFGAFYVF